MATDREKILKLGGPTKVAKLLNLDNENHKGSRRVSNWMHRGIPPRVILENPHIFAPDGFDKYAKNKSAT